jgi:Protein of unknown function (DUF3710)
MALFRRKKNDLDEAPAPSEDVPGSADDHEEASGDAQQDGGQYGADEATTARQAHGPWDSTVAPDDGRPRVDLGGLRVPGFPGMELRLEVDRDTERVVAATAVAAGGQLQIQAFAAPRTGGLWTEVRVEITDSVREAGGSVDESPGPFGPELLATVPGDVLEGGLEPARFVGVDGPRWFVRGVFSGAAAQAGESADLLEQVLAETIVVRGDQAMAPRDLLTLHMPDQSAPVSPGPAPPPALDDLRQRGPEITEIH